MNCPDSRCEPEAPPPEAPPTAYNPTATLTASFAPLPPDRFTLAAKMEGRGQVQTRPYRTHYSAGTLVTNIALPDANQAFTGWAGDTNGAVFLDPSRFVLTMNASKVVTAHFTIRPRLEVVRCLGELSRDGFDLRLTGDLGERYLIQTTRELASTPNVMLWTDLGALTNTLGMVEFLDTTNTNFTQRFYRAEEAP